MENINCEVITKFLECEDGKEIYSQDFQDYIETFFSEEDLLEDIFS